MGEQAPVAPAWVEQAAQAGFARGQQLREQGHDAADQVYEAVTAALAVAQEQQPGVPVARLEAMITLLWPEEITPMAKRMLSLLCQEYQGGEGQ